MLSSQCCEPLLLGVRIDVCADNEGNNIEEWNPCLLREELLGKRQADGRGHPADLHDWPEAGLDRGPDLVEGASACDDGHGDQVDAVLDRRDLVRVLVKRSKGGLKRRGEQRTTKLLTRICKTFAFKLVLPAKIRCRMLMSTWPSGALMKAP
jgi:hypothetical protein